MNRLSTYPDFIELKSSFFSGIPTLIFSIYLMPLLLLSSGIQAQQGESGWEEQISLSLE